MIASLPAPHAPRPGVAGQRPPLRRRALPALPLRRHRLMSTGVDLGRLGVWGHLDTLRPSSGAGLRRARRGARLRDAVGARDGRARAVHAARHAGRQTPRACCSAPASSRSGAMTRRPRGWRRMTLQEASGGRFVLGLGVSHPHLAERLRGHTFDRPLTRMRDFLAAYRSAIYKGPMAEGVPEPPILLAALRERMLGLAATDADGAFPYLVTPERVAWTRDRCWTRHAPDRRAGARGEHAGRPGDRCHRRARGGACVPGALPAHARPITPAGRCRASSEADWEKPGSDRLVDAMVAWGDVEALHARDRRAGRGRRRPRGRHPAGGRRHRPRTCTCWRRWPPWLSGRSRWLACQVARSMP